MITERLALVASLQFGLGGPFDAHVYALAGRDGVLLIDTGAGTDPEALLANVRRAFGARPIVAACLTHGHMDHGGGAAALRRATGCRVICSTPTRPIVETADEQAAGLARARAQGLYPADARLQPCTVDTALADGEAIVMDDVALTAIHVRGHSVDGCAYLTHVAGVPWLFAGDIVFYGGVLGLVNAEGSDMAGYCADLPKLAGLGIEGLFPGHGLFTLRGGQRHIDRAIGHLGRGFLGPQIGQGEALL